MPTGGAKQEKRLRIISAAAEVFSEKGYGGTIMADIAARAQVGKGTLYEYFDSKEALFFGVFQWFMDNSMLTARVQMQDLALPVDLRMQAMVRAITRMFVEGADLYPLMLEFWAAASLPETHLRLRSMMKHTYDQFRRWLIGLLHEGEAAGRFQGGLNHHSLASGLIGALDGIFLQCWLDPSLEAERLTEDFFQTFLNGITAREKSDD